MPGAGLWFRATLVAKSGDIVWPKVLSDGAFGHGIAFLQQSRVLAYR